MSCWHIPIDVRSAGCVIANRLMHPHNDGEPIVVNGLSLGKSHHVGHDNYILRIKRDYEVHIPRDILEEIDGSMLNHALIEVLGSSIQTARRNDWK